MPDERVDLAVGDRRDELVATVALSYAHVTTDERLAAFISLVGSRGQVESVSAKTVDTLCKILGVGPGELIEVQKRPVRQSR
jgi:hypothetical protein